MFVLWKDQPFKQFLQVEEVKGDDVICVSRNAATLAGPLFTLHVSQVHIDMPTLTEKDKEVSVAYKL